MSTKFGHRNSKIEKFQNGRQILTLKCRHGDGHPKKHHQTYFRYCTQKSLEIQEGRQFFHFHDDRSGSIPQ